MTRLELDALPLVDHHCHGLIQRDLTQEEFAGLASESDWPAPPEVDALDSPFGLAVRRLCAPALELHPLATMADYLARRTELGHVAVNQRLTRASGIDRFLIETGFPAAGIASPDEMAELSGARANQVIRLEAIAERIGPDTSAASFAADFAAELDRQAGSAVGLKTIIAYRWGLDLFESPPAPAEVATAAGEWLRSAESTGRYRLSHPVLLNQLIWTAVERRAVLQIHVGFGDADVQLNRADPSRLTPFLHATRTSGARFALLHCYPYLREAAALAHNFPHVWFDTSLVSHYAGPSYPRLLGEALEIAPFGKILFASDAYGLAEHYLVSATMWRRGLGAILAAWIDDGWLTPRDATRYARMIGGENAQALYRLAR